MIVAHAPGKLFVAGEFAVVEPGQPAVLVAVDRYVTVRLTAAPGDHGTVDSPGRGTAPLRWSLGADGVHAEDPERAFRHVLAAIGVVERLRTERGLPARYADLLIESGLDDPSGRKYGLGSSAAVTVATVRALGEFHALHLSAEHVYRLALLATVRVSPAASGGDVAASTFGGWLRYAAPDRADLLARLDRETVTALLAAPWPGLDLTPLPAPRALRLLVGWTGTPASTDAQVARTQVARTQATRAQATRAQATRTQGTRTQGTAGDREAFLGASRSAVEHLTAALLAGDDDACCAALREARRALAAHAAATGVVIETDLLRTLCEVAEGAGAAAKSSGAGGGDCGLTLAPAGADITAIEAGWREHGIVPLPLAVASPSRHATRRDHSTRSDRTTAATTPPREATR